MRLKVVTKKAQQVLSIDDDSTVDKLLDLLLQDEIITNKEDVKIKAGFPPKDLELDDPDNKLLDLGVRAGDKLIIEESSTIATPTEGVTKSDTQKIELKSNPIPKGAKAIPFNSGLVKLHTIEDNNSCLFDSIKYLTSSSIDLREIVAQHILADPINYNDAILGKPVDRYVDWIMKSTSWGGAIELQILSMFLGVRIDSIDVESGRIDSFNPDGDEYIVVLYTGIHYDAVVFEQNGRETRVFKKEDNDFLKGAKLLAEGLNHKGYVTNTSTFKVKCKTCGHIADGEKGVTNHASKVGHFDFGEV